MIYILLFTLLVGVIGIVTHILNAKPLCNHDWHEHDEVVKCSKCNKCIPNRARRYSEAA